MYKLLQVTLPQLLIQILQLILLGLRWEEDESVRKIKAMCELKAVNAYSLDTLLHCRRGYSISKMKYILCVRYSMTTAIAGHLQNVMH